MNSLLLVFVGTAPFVFLGIIYGIPANSHIRDVYVGTPLLYYLVMVIFFLLWILTLSSVCRKEKSYLFPLLTINLPSTYVMVRFFPYQLVKIPSLLKYAYPLSIVFSTGSIDLNTHIFEYIQGMFPFLSDWIYGRLLPWMALIIISAVCVVTVKKTKEKRQP